MEMTALMDVMFLVLVFFVYSVMSMSVHRGVKVQLPSGAGEAEPGERVIVTIDGENNLQLNARALEKDALVGEVGRLVRVKPDIPVLISGDARSDLGVGISLLSDLKAAGVEKVSFQVEGEKRR